MLRHPNTPARRGVILLIVLAVLALFVLLALTFILVAAHYYRSARSAARAQERTDSPQALLDDAFHQVLRGSENTASVLRTHSLLEDMYGRMTVPVIGILGTDDDGDSTVDEIDGSEIIGVAGTDDDGDGTVDETDGTEAIGIPATDDDGDGAVDETDGTEVVTLIPADFTPICGEQLYEMTLPDPARQNGCVITMLDGPAAGQSTRIVGLNPATGKGQILPFRGAPPAPGNRYLTNGAPFSGTGFGFNTASANLDLAFTGTYGTWPYALLPNPANSVVYPTTPAPVNPAGVGGANEDYDAVDYQNMLLAMETSIGSIPIPSLHRPELVQYWTTALSCTFGALPDVLKHAAVLRPLSHFHPQFDGGNPSFDATWDGVPTASNLRWDVDNNGDGQPDSIWVDLGFPIRSTPDGRLYKPLFAILCTDLDGRFNVNAHGSSQQTEPAYYANVDLSNAYFAPPVSITPAFTNTFGGAPIYLPRGLGWGPGEVNPARLFSDYPAYSNFSSLLQLRYGTDSWPGIATVDDYLSRNIWTQYAGAYWTFGTPSAAGAYGSPPAPKAKAVIGLDTTGHPIYGAMGVDEQTDDPYELNLSQRTIADNPFTPAELERILRPYDSDVGSLPGRLAALISAAGRHSVTTESWDLPCPSLAVSAELRSALPDKRLHHLTDLLAARGIPSTAYKYLWPPEMLAGLRMDLNRPFGNAYDDNTNNVIDEPGRVVYTGAAYQLDPNLTGEIVVAGNPEKALQYDSTGNPITTTDFSHVNGIDVNQDGAVDSVDEALGRQLYARHLYVLTLMIINYPQVAAGSLSQADKDRARVVAQWAANAVDFRDRDSIMTPFEFDLSPLYDDSATPDGNPWDVDGVVGLEASPSPDDDEATHPYRSLVWGCERPELLITETLALHDRRTEDLNNDSDQDKKIIDTPPDDDFDQRFKPQGSLFVELYNPNTVLEPLPAEVCSGTDGTTGAGVDLTNLGTDGTDSSPVWRLAIVTQANGAVNPDDQTSPAALERTIYFVDQGAATFPSDGAKVRFYPNSTLQGKIQPITPGRYALVGPGEPGGTAVSTTYLSLKSGATQGDSTTRRIVLDPDAPGVGISSDGTTDDLVTLSLTYLPMAMPVIIDQPRRLSITEPDAGYPSADFEGQPYDPVAGYPTPYDQPQDAASASPNMWNQAHVKVKDNDIFPKVCVIHLQRLANPLQPYDAKANPYLTIDTMPVDVNAFNGVTADKDLGTAVVEAGVLTDIRTRQRGETTVAAYNNTNNLWTQEPFNPHTLLDKPSNDGAGLPATPMTTHNLNSPFHHTLGYLNYAFGTPRAMPPGDPVSPFPWLTWPNRPFVSQYELLEVPASSSRQLLMNSADITPTDNAFAMSFSYGSGLATADPFTNAKDPFGHLLNFCFSTSFGSSPAAADPPSNLARLLDFVHVPSRFVGTCLQGNPETFANAALGTHSFPPPFQHIPLYCEPGKVNLNTIFDQNVWEGLLNFFPDMDTSRTTPMFWNEFVASRRGYDVSADPALINSAYPTRFANPFRSAGGASLVPTADLLTTVEREPNATLLREQSSTSSRPLLQFDDAIAATITARAGGQPTISDLNRPDQNPYFAHQVMNRLGNLTTTRSNVYAIWITVGYFEVEPITLATAPLPLTPDEFAAIYPDSYQLGQEIGTDSGEIKRHRAFYIFDRSIPVGFQRGENLNVDKAVLLKRFIE